MRKNILFFVSTILLLTVIFFCFSATAYSQSVERSTLEDKEEIDLQEQALLKEMKQIMKEYGCEYSGITMTKVYLEDGTRSYLIRIHHRNISILDEDELAALKERLGRLMCGLDHVEAVYELSCSS